MTSNERQQEGKRQPVQVVPGDCRKPLGYGLRGEELSSQVLPPAKRHFNGARDFEASERAYNGGASIVDIFDSRES